MESRAGRQVDPLTVDGLIYASSIVMLRSARRQVSATVVSPPPMAACARAVRLAYSPSSQWRLLLVAQVAHRRVGDNRVQVSVRGRPMAQARWLSGEHCDTMA